MIDAYIIHIATEQDNDARKCRKTIENTESELNPIFMNATVPDTIDSHLDVSFNHFNSDRYKWNWPHVPMMDGYDLKTGLYKTCYRANDQKKVEACLISHMRAWDACVTQDKPIVVLEADARFTRKFEVETFKDAYLVGLNDPRGATRRADVFHYKVSSFRGLQRVPVVNKIGEKAVPQGLAGNSAYYITPQAAKELLDLVATHGGWPNDAIMCRELVSNMQVIWPYYTKVEKTKSTTTG